MSCAVTSTINKIGEEVVYSYGQVKVGMSIYMDDISVAGSAEEVQKGIRNCKEMETKKKMKYGLKKSKYMVVKTGKEKEELLIEAVKAGNIEKSEKYKYLGITINQEGNLKDHIKYINGKCEAISREIEAIGTKAQVGSEEIREKLKLFETCFMTTLTYGMEAWSNIRKEEMKEIEKIQAKNGFQTKLLSESCCIE